MLFNYCVPTAVSSVEFYPSPYYEKVYRENQKFAVEADNQSDADLKAYAFLANLQSQHDREYFSLLDQHNIRYRKREEIELRRPLYLRELRRRQASDPSFGNKKSKPVVSDTQLKEYFQSKNLPAPISVLNYSYEQNPQGLHYRFFRQLSDHQFVYGLVFLGIIVLLILLFPQFRELGMLTELGK